MTTYLLQVLTNRAPYYQFVAITAVTCLFYSLARLNFLGEKCSFKISDNPLIQCVESRSVTVKQLFDYLKTEEYRQLVDYWC